MSSPAAKVDLASVSGGTMPRLRGDKGLRDTPLQQAFFASPSPCLVLQFVRITMTGLHEPETTEPFIEALFRECDPGNSGRVPLSTLLHLLAEVDTPSSLSVEEVRSSAGYRGCKGLWTSCLSSTLPCALLLSSVTSLPFLSSPPHDFPLQVNDLLKMTGILAELQSRDAKAIYSTQVDYRALARHMVFPLSKPLGGIGSIGKAAGAGAAAGAAAAGAGSS